MGEVHFKFQGWYFRGAFDSAKNHKRQRRKRQSVTAKREKSQTPKFVRLGQVRLGKISVAVKTFGVCDFSRLAVTDWRLWFLALMTATPFSKFNFVLFARLC